MDPTTATLATAAANAPRAGFAALHHRTQRQLFLWAALHVSPPLREWMPLDDFVQEVWARAYASFRAFDPALGSFRGWLCGIAYNVLREQLRFVRVRRGTTSLGGTDAELRDPATSVVSRAVRDEALAAMLGAIDSLDMIDRRVASWRGLEGLSHEEVGRRLGVSAVAAESRWRRVLGRLQAVLPPRVIGD